MIGIYIIAASLSIYLILRAIFRIKLVKDQDQEIKKLNARIFEKDQFIIDLIKKYGKPEEGVKFMNNLKNQINNDHEKEKK